MFVTARCWVAVPLSYSLGPIGSPANGEIVADISTLRHNDDPNFQPLLKTDKVTLALKGKQQGDQYYFEGNSPNCPALRSIG